MFSYSVTEVVFTVNDSLTEISRFHRERVKREHCTEAVITGPWKVKNKKKKTLRFSPVLVDTLIEFSLNGNLRLENPC